MLSIPTQGDNIYVPDLGKERVSSVEHLHGAVLVYVSRGSVRTGINWDLLGPMQERLRDVFGGAEECCGHREAYGLLLANS